MNNQTNVQICHGTYFGLVIARARVRLWFIADRYEDSIVISNVQTKNQSKLKGASSSRRSLSAWIFIFSRSLPCLRSEYLLKGRMYGFEALTFNIHGGYLEAIVRGHRAGLLTTADYNNLCQCENLDDIKMHLSATKYGSYLQNGASSTYLMNLIGWLWILGFKAYEMISIPNLFSMSFICRIVWFL